MKRATDSVSGAEPARLDPDGTAKPKTEIAGVFPDDGRAIGFDHQILEYKVRSTDPRPSEASPGHDGSHDPCIDCFHIREQRIGQPTPGMANERLVAAFRACRAKVPGVSPERYPSDAWATDEKYDYVRSHIAWMCDEGVRLVDQGKREKAMRWLGFVQGAVWSWLPVTIAELKDMNRTPVVDPSEAYDAWIAAGGLPDPCPPEVQVIAEEHEPLDSLEQADATLLGLDTEEYRRLRPRPTQAVATGASLGQCTCVPPYRQLGVECPVHHRTTNPLSPELLPDDGADGGLHGVR